MANESLRIQWRGLPQSPVLEAVIRAEAARLSAWYPGLKVWGVTLEPSCPSGSAACVSIEVRGPQSQVIANSAQTDRAIALRDAFEAVFRKFERRVRRDRRRGRAHENERLAA
jgi:ribosome-associated translation inhibitor RaiA